ncbi:MAG: hypothetical protein COV45_06940 [Deltaproteobacteria bacterium CG11_big_fil_rev_8_21_14_0_20_47_16]|nr:MAG: hypothetical protein COV45_06940 [Deltaproteobacteria bacterium CG11_big_fil_rev_8_21_14_0_20_47_16]
MKSIFKRLSRNQRGVAATEYMLIIAVIVIAVVVIGKKVFVDQFFTQGVTAAGSTVQKWLTCDPSNADCNE